MELSLTEVNFVKISNIILTIVPQYLRKCFKKKWNEKYPKKKWKSNAKSGEDLFRKLPKEVREGEARKEEVKRLRTGIESDWDTTLLVYVMLDSGLKLIKGCRPKSKRELPLFMSEQIVIIREIRNSVFAHAESMSCPIHEFEDAMRKLKSVAKHIFGESAENEIEQMENAQVGERIQKELKRKLEEEFNHLKDCLIHKYTTLFGKHHIHTIDKKGQICLEEEEIGKFAVKLKITCYSMPTETFRDEAGGPLASVIDGKGGDIDLNQLIRNHNRVTFVRGIAGMGKTILAKQLAHQWATGFMFKDFHLCIMFECREVNSYAIPEGLECSKSELLAQFLRTKFDYGLGNGQGCLFIVDGLDELSDINESIIVPLLRRDICSASKVLITGRPHIESKLKEIGEVGGFQGVEIQGLNDVQIREYVEKFNYAHSATVDVGSGKLPSQRFLPILHVPQFLNTFCCIGSLLKGEKIGSAVELYSWTILLLLKEHADKQRKKKKEISEIFAEYSLELLILGKVCHTSLNENKIILDESDFESLLSRSMKGKQFIKSLFVSVADNQRKQFQFKHLTIMEFLSALYICSCRNRMEILRDKIQRNFIEVVVYSCQLIGERSCKNIVRELLKNSECTEFVDEGSFLTNILVLLKECNLERDLKFKISQEIIMCFLNGHTIEKSLMVSNVQMLNCADFYSSVEQSEKLCEITEKLIHIYKCDESDLREAFANFRYRHFYVNKYETIKVAEYLKDVRWIILFEMNVSLTTARKQLCSAVYGGTCKRISFRSCELQVNDSDQNEALEFNLDVLSINTCTFKDKNSFAKTMQWGASSFQDIRLRYLPNIEREWWLKVVEDFDIDSREQNTFKLKKLDTFKCNPITTEMKIKMLKCGVDVTCSTLIVSPDSNITSSEILSSSISIGCQTMPKVNSNPIDLKEEDIYFIKLAKIMLEIVPNYLKELFITKWNSKFPSSLWTDGGSNGRQLYNTLCHTTEERQTKFHKTYKTMIFEVNVNLWDPSTLFFVLLQADLDLLDNCRAACDRIPPLSISENIDCIRVSRDSFLRHVNEMSLASCEFGAILSRLEDAMSALFGMNAVKEVQKILNSQITAPLAIHLKAQLQREMKINSEYNDYIEWKDAKRNIKNDIFELELCADEANFVRIKKTLLNVFPKHLRLFFIEHWNNRYPDNIWKSDSANGELLAAKLSDAVKNVRENQLAIKEIETGHVAQWSIGTLMLVILDSNLKLIKTCKAKSERRSTCITLCISEELEMLQSIQRSFFTCKCHKMCSTAEFLDVVMKLKCVAKKVFNEIAEREVIEIEDSKTKKKIAIKLDQLMVKDNSHSEGQSQLSESFEGYKQSMRMSVEEANFATIEVTLLNIVAKYLRNYFKELWDEKYSNSKWMSDNGSGDRLLHEMADEVKSIKEYENEIKILKVGHEQDWSIATLSFVLLDAGLKLIKECRPKDERIPPLHMSEEIQALRDIDRSVSEHKHNMFCSSADFERLTARIKKASKSIFGSNAEVEIDKIIKSHITKLNAIRMKKFLDEEKNHMTEDVIWDKEENEIDCTYNEKQESEYNSFDFLELSTEGSNFVKIAKIIVSIIPVYLCKVFKDLWNEKFTNDKWQSDGGSGKSLLSKLLKIRAADISKVATGEEHKWDSSLLTYILLERNLGLTEGKDKEKENNAINSFSNIRNTIFGHIPEMSLTAKDFTDNMEKLKGVVIDLCCSDAVEEIERIQNVQIQEPLSEEEKQRLKKEREQALRDELVTRYSMCREKHHIHTIDENGRISLIEAHINDFALNMKIARVQAHDCRLHIEEWQASEHLGGKKNNFIAMKQLIDNDCRVTFVQGIAGTGKSVLAKKLALSWANEELFTNFKFCIMFECREINRYVKNKGLEQQKNKLFDEFLKTEFNVKLNTGKGVLFVVDGLNELDDIKSASSMIWQLLDVKNSKYSASKFIITGRPHIYSEISKAENFLGSLRRFEVQGFDDDQIKIYVSKFFSLKENMQKKDMANKVSERSIPLLSIPQYLNSFCCVALLKAGEITTAELYCWILYLLLKQHGKKLASEKKQVDEVFKIYSAEIEDISIACYKLLHNENMSLTGQNISLLTDSEKENELIEILFGDLSHNFMEKHQDLLIMEFLSALSICSSEKYLEIMKEILKKGFVDTVLFASELVASIHYEGIVKNVLKITTNGKVISDMLANILKLVCESSLDEKIKFQVSLKIVATFLTKEAIDQECTINSLKILYCGPLFKAEEKDSKNLYAITNCMRDRFNCSTEDILETFGNIRIGELMVNEVETVKCVECLQGAQLINFHGFSINLNAARREVERVGAKKCRFVWIEKCKAKLSKLAETQKRVTNAFLDELVICNSILDINSFLTACDWGTSSGKLMLVQLEIDNEWWLKLIDVITRRKDEGTLSMKELHISGCVPEMSDEVRCKLWKVSNFKIN